jgi:hypothetical protein
MVIIILNNAYTIKIPIFLLTFGQKQPILGRLKKNLLVILDKLIWTCPVSQGHLFFDQASVGIYD